MSGPEEIWSRDEPASPCVRICVMHPAAGLCVGCLRTLAEIAGWGAMAPEARREVLAALPGRAGQIKARRGGRKGRESG